MEGRRLASCGQTGGVTDDPKYNFIMTQATEDRARGLRIAFDLFEAGEAIMRQNLRRRYPEASESEIEAKLIAWLRDRPSLADVPGFRRRPWIQ